MVLLSVTSNRRIDISITDKKPEYCARAEL